jgi:hypothetical protein
MYRYVIEMTLLRPNTTEALPADILCGLPQSDLLQTPLAGFNGRRSNERDVGSEETHLGSRARTFLLIFNFSYHYLQHS